MPRHRAIDANSFIKCGGTANRRFFCQLVSGIFVGEIPNLCDFGDEPKFTVGIHGLTMLVPEFILCAGRLCHGHVFNAHDRGARRL